MKKLVLFLSMACTLPLYATENFQNIDGLNFYQFFDVARDAELKEINVSFRKMMAKQHPDNGGNPERAKQISNAYSVLKNRREKYDLWLASTGGASTQNPFSDEDLRRRTLDSMINEIAKSLLQYDIHRMTAAQFAEIGRFMIIYNQRFMPFASLEPQDLKYLITEFLLNPEAYEKWSHVELYTLGVGVIEVLRQYQMDGGAWNGYHQKLGEVQLSLEQALAHYSPNTLISQTAEKVYHHLTGYRYTPAAHNSCEQALETGVRFRDSQGREWIIPVRIEIKLGP